MADAPAQTQPQQQLQQQHQQLLLQMPAQQPPPAAAGEETSFKLFVGQVPRNMDSQALAPYFAEFGGLLEVFVVRDARSGVSKGCAFVRFRAKSTCERCIEQMSDKVVLEGSAHPLQISFAHSDGEAKLFVGQLPLNALEPDVQRVFEPFGEILEVFIFRQKDSGVSKGAGFVRFAQVASAKRAIQDLNGRFTMDGGSGPLKVDVARSLNSSSATRYAAVPSRVVPMPPGAARYLQPPPPVGYGWFPAATLMPPPPPPASLERMGFADDSKHLVGGGGPMPKLFVAGLTVQTNEATLFQLFSLYGAVREVVVLRHPNGHSKLCGFVRYASEDEANNAVASLSARYMLPGSQRPLSVRFAGPGNMPLESKLFVGRLPPHMDEAALDALFRSFGEITEVHLMRDASGAPKGSAFVKFVQKEHALAAVQALNGLPPVQGGAPLSVSFALNANSKSATAAAGGVAGAFQMPQQPRVFVPGMAPALSLAAMHAAAGVVGIMPYKPAR
jgi:RNA recognition motif-containing protein